MIMMAQSHLIPLEGSHHLPYPLPHPHPHHNPEVIQQPRRFACDRCRMQKLRCERDIWRPSLMPCKRCRKARMVCTISSMDRPSSKKKSKEKALATIKSEKTTTGTQEKSPLLEVSEHSPVDNPPSIYREAIPEGFNLMGVSGFGQDGMQTDKCYTGNVGFEEYTVPVFSGLITPPSMDSEREHQIALQPTSFIIPQQQDWTPVSDFKGSDGFEYDDPFPCLEDREQWWDQENLRRLLDVNMQLLDCQSLVSQQLAMLGNMDANVALSNLECASQNAMRYSQQFLEVVKLFVDRGLTTMAAVPIPGSIIANAFVPEMHTPAQSRRPSYVQQSQTVPSTAEPAGETPVSSQVSPVATFVSSSSSQSSWQGAQFEDVQVSLILTTINCYTCLVGSYHIILSYLLHELMAVSPSDQQASPTFSGFAAAFAATAQVQQPDRNSRLRHIFHNCIRALAHVEMSLGMPEQHCVASSAFSFPGSGQHRYDGILSGSVAEALLSTLVGQKFCLFVNGLATGKNSMKEIISTINQFFGIAQPVSQVASTIQ